MSQAGRSEKLKTPEARASFAYVFEPRQPKDKTKKPKRCLTFLFDEDADLGPMKRAAEKAVRQRWGDNIPKNLRSPFRKGEEKKHLEGYEEGMTFVYSSTYDQIQVVDRRGHALKPEEFWAGCYCKAMVNAYTYDGEEGPPGVTFGLISVIKMREGERFDGRESSDVNEDFADELDEDAWTGDDAPSTAEGIFG